VVVVVVGRETLLSVRLKQPDNTARATTNKGI
jgi:hypothetical protein